VTASPIGKRAAPSGEAITERYRDLKVFEEPLL
jgi:hypothetical protein